VNIFFFFILVFSSNGQLHDVKPSPQYSTYAECTAERERLYYEIPVSGFKRVITPCAELSITHLPRCE